MWACRHFQKYGMRTDITPFDKPWSAWVTVYTSSGEVYYQGFETGLMWKYLEHLLISKECRREVGIGKKNIQRLLKEIDRVWRLMVHE